MTVAQQMGVWAEAQAEKILRDAGYSLIHSNYHSRYGEIDLIVSRDLELVFVEVKSRNKTRHGSAIEVITLSKQKKILKTALSFVAQYEQYEQFYYRFDVICFDNVITSIADPCRVLFRDFTSTKTNSKFLLTIRSISPYLE